MNKQGFLRERKPVWERFETLVDRASHPRTDLSSAEVSELSELFRALCYDLAQVRSHDWARITTAAGFPTR